MRRGETNRSIRGAGNLLNQTHQQNLGPRVGPVVLEMVLCLGPGIVVGRLESLQELRELGIDFGREHRHLESGGEGTR